MWYKIIFSILAIASLVILQVTFLSAFGAYFAGFNLVLAGLIFLFFLVDFAKIVFFIIFAGILLDLYSSLPFGIFLVSLFVAAIISEIIIFNFLTHRSFYSVLSLGLIATLCFNSSFLILVTAAYLLGLSDFSISGGFWLELIYQIINIGLLLTAMFFLTNSLSKKFKPNFI